MELELKKERFTCCRSAPPLSLTLEETAENIVPDRDADVGRIIDTGACLLLQSRAVAEGRLTATGTVEVTVLYAPEDGSAPHALHYALPFEHSVKLPEDCDAACLEGQVGSVEVRLLNPRKLFTRLDVDWRVTPYCRGTLTTCGEIENEAEYAIQTLCERCDVSLIRSIVERDFAFSDELTLPGGKEPIAELLCHRVRLRVTEAKLLGKKIVLKGVACLSLLYAAENGTLCSYAEELPFSQIFDGDEELSGEGSVSAVLNLSACEVHSGDETGRSVSVKLFLHAAFLLRETERVCCISDLYSTTHELDAKLETVTLPQEPRISTVSQNVREQLETGTEVKSVLSADVSFGSVGLHAEGERTTLRAAATLSILYLDEADVPLSLRRRVELSMEVSADADAQVSVEAVCAGDVTTALGASGVELRFTAEFTLCETETAACACLTALSAEPSPTDADAPALVLRAPREGESLWDVAKQYRTTADNILAANELTDGVLPEAGQMLLIPRCR